MTFLSLYSIVNRGGPTSNPKILWIIGYNYFNQLLNSSVFQLVCITFLWLVKILIDKRKFPLHWYFGRLLYESMIVQKYDRAKARCSRLWDKKTTHLVIFEHGCIRIDFFVLCEGHANKLKERLGDRCLTQQPVQRWQNYFQNLIWFIEIIEMNFW